MRHLSSTLLTTLQIVTYLWRIRAQGIYYEEEEAEEGFENVIVQVKNDDEAVISQVSEKYRGQIHSTLKRGHAVAMRVPKSALASLKAEDNVNLVEYDKLVFPMAFEETPWGLEAVRAVSTAKRNVTIPATSSNQANDKNCFKICIIDGGVLLGHEDISFDKKLNNVKGTDWSLPMGQSWDKPIYYHGTHVTGIMLAEANNGIGIQGVVGDSSNICLYVARVFDDAGLGQFDSVVLNAAEWCADMEAKVINMSLGSTTSGSQVARSVYDKIVADGALLFAAAGNDGDQAYNYPASFDSVISVGSVNKDMTHSLFSNYNDQVDLVGPGAEIKSTVARQVVIDQSGVKYTALIMQFSQTPNTPVTGLLMDCGKALSDYDCVGAQNKICLIERGGDTSSATFKDKAQRCALQGGIGAIIYNYEAGLLAGTLEVPGMIRIPVVGVSRVDGLAIKRSGQATISLVEGGYQTLSGTSMAVPFVSGVAAKIWSARPECTNEQVRQALLNSALNLGERNLFGKGLVQADRAYAELIKNPSPCGDGLAPAGSSGEGNSASQSSTNSWWTTPSSNTHDDESGTSGTGNTKPNRQWTWNKESGNRNLLRTRKQEQVATESEPKPVRVAL